MNLTPPPPQRMLVHILVNLTQCRNRYGTVLVFTQKCATVKYKYCLVLYVSVYNMFNKSVYTKKCCRHGQNEREFPSYTEIRCGRGREYWASSSRSMWLPAVAIHVCTPLHLAFDASDGWPIVRYLSFLAVSVVVCIMCTGTDCFIRFYTVHSSRLTMSCVYTV